MQSGCPSVANIANHDPRPDLSGARIGVAGLGTSGRAALKALAARGIAARGIDRSEAAIAAANDDATGAHLIHAADEADFAERASEDVDLLVVSPGIAPHTPLYARAAQRGTSIISEIELAWLLQAPLPGGGYAPWLTLTGTNGKTTTVTMTSSILTAAGLVAPAIGNVGTPAVLVAERGGVDVLPAELSSFQLHTTHSVRALASACLNIDDDHLDWHGSPEAYAAAKGRVHLGTSGACLYSRHDPITEQLVRDADVTEGARAISIGLDAPPLAGIGIVDGLIVDRAFHDERATHGVELAALTDLAHLAPEGQVPAHVVIDALFAAGLARAAGVAPEAIAEGLRAFSPGDHRIQTIAEVDGVRYINDSKATNAHAARASLSAMPAGSVVWIAGGLAKGARFDGLIADIAPTLASVVLIGVDQEPLTSALANVAPDIPVQAVDPASEDPMTEAVALAQRVAKPGNVVLLAPACASMDQFPNYASRGDQFAAAVRSLRA